MAAPAPRVIDAEAIRKLRRRRGWSQSHLAELIRRAPSTVSKIESGLHQPSRDTADAIAEALGVELDGISVLDGQVKPPMTPF